MATKLGVSDNLLKPLTEFVNSESIPVEVVAGNGTSVRVVEGAAGQQSSTTELRAGGWIACSTAFEAAARLQIQPRQIGQLLDRLDIRIRACQLGCFE